MSYGFASYDPNGWADGMATWGAQRGYNRGQMENLNYGLARRRQIEGNWASANYNRDPHRYDEGGAWDQFLSRGQQTHTNGFVPTPGVARPQAPRGMNPWGGGGSFDPMAFLRRLYGGMR